MAVRKIITRKMSGKVIYISVPMNARLLSCTVVDGVPHLVLHVTEEEEVKKERRSFEVIETGVEIKSRYHLVYYASFADSKGQIKHIFERQERLITTQ